MTTSEHYELFREATRAEHAVLRRYVERLQEVADAVGDVPLATLREQIHDVHNLLSGYLIPHAEAEDHVIYPLVAEMLHTLEGIQAMNRDHVEIRRYAAELIALEPKLSEARLRRVNANALRRILYGLAAVLRLHLDQEDVYLGLLSVHLTPDAARSAVEMLQAATQKAQARGAAAGAERTAGSAVTG
jgi:hemerythrin-like domain-containing protein